MRKRCSRTRIHSRIWASPKPTEYIQKTAGEWKTTELQAVRCELNSASSAVVAILRLQTVSIKRDHIIVCVEPGGIYTSCARHDACHPLSASAPTLSSFLTSYLPALIRRGLYSELSRTALDSDCLAFRPSKMLPPFPIQWYL